MKQALLSNNSYRQPEPSDSRNAFCMVKIM